MLSIDDRLSPMYVKQSLQNTMQMQTFFFPLSGFNKQISILKKHILHIVILLKTDLI